MVHRIRRKPVSSSNLESVGYDKKTHTLEIEFVNGGLYHYFDVPAIEYKSLITAGSVGGYFADQIKGTYGYARIG